MAYYDQFGSKFKSVDGRIYKSDVREKNIYKVVQKYENSIYQKCKMSAQQVYDVESYLSSGKRPGLVSSEEKKRIVDEYHLERNNGKGAFKGDPQIIYSILEQKYPEAISKFHNDDGKGYKRIVYAVYYGNKPCTVISTSDGKEGIL